MARYRVVDPDLLIDNEPTEPGDIVTSDDVADHILDVLARRGQIEEVEEEAEADYPRALDGGWYELSDGSKVQGKDAAHEAEAEL